MVCIVAFVIVEGSGTCVVIGADEGEVGLVGLFGTDGTVFGSLSCVVIVANVGKVGLLGLFGTSVGERPLGRVGL